MKEFTELQGIVGGLYARAQGHSETVAQAIYDHYKPESVEDAVPRTTESAVLSIADKADTIAGMFALGMQPTGSRDPFALRRQANGIVRIIADQKLPISVMVLMLQAYSGLAEPVRKPASEALSGFENAVRDFFRERVQFYLQESLGMRYDVVNSAVKARGEAPFSNVVDTLARARAVAAVIDREEFAAIAAAFKRTKNILQQAAEKGYDTSGGLPSEPTGEPAECELQSSISAIRPEFNAFVLARDYEKALATLAALRGPVDTFFDSVMVMTENPDVRHRRLGILNTLYHHFSTIADFSEIVTEKPHEKPETRNEKPTK